MKKVLVISYLYPPLSGVGIIRTLKFTKYLPEYGWLPHVLSIRNRDRFYTDLGDDEIPEHVLITRSWNLINNLSIVEGGLRRLGVNSRVLVPDAYVGWILSTIRAGKKIIKEEDIDLIYVSCPPHSSSLIGAHLSKITGVPFVLDLRDAWTLNPYSTGYLFDTLRKFDNMLEEYVFQFADFIVAATDGIMNDYITKYPFIKSKVMTIPNGFDLDDIPQSSSHFEKFTIVYTGFFYGSRSPELLFAAFKEILQKNMIPKRSIQFLWAGRDAPFVHKLAEKYQIKEIVNYIGIVSKKEADTFLYRSHLLFLVIGNTEEASENNTLTGKIFPYLASGTPILAVIPDGAARELLEEYSDASYVINSDDLDAAVDAIMDVYTQWRDNKMGKDMDHSPKTNRFRQDYNYKALSKRLAGVFTRVSFK